ncbi:MAG: ABC transporter substrate-binding protein [Clostridia bacterium]
MKKLVSLILVTVLALGMTSVALAADTLKIGGIAPLTGAVSVYGLLVKDGVELYKDEVNARGGVLGRQVEIVWMDDTGDAVEAVNAYNQLAGSGISALIGPVTTTPTLAVGARAAEDKMPMITASATAYDVTSAGENIFRACFLDPYQAELMALYANQNLKATKVAVLYDNTNDYSIGLYEAFTKKAEELGMEVVAAESAVENDADYTPQLGKIADAQPDAVFVCYYYETAALVLRQAVDVGLEATMMGADGWTDIQKQLSDDLALLDKAAYCDSFSAADDSEVAKAFVSSFTTKYANSPAGFNALGYDAAKIMLSAIEQAGSTDSAAIIAALKATNLDCATGHISFNEHNDPIKSAFIMGFEAGVPTLITRVDP